MSTRNVYEEVLRFLIEADGNEDVARLARQLVELGEGGDDAKKKVAGLLEEFSRDQGLDRTARRFRELGTEIIQLGSKQETTKARITALTEEIGKAETPTKKQANELARLTKELNKTGGDLSKARDDWRQARTELEKSGVATERYANLQGQIAQKQKQSADALRDFARGSLEARQAAGDFADRLAAQNREVQDQGRTLLDTAGDLDEYAARTAAAAQQTENLKTTANVASGVLGKLKAIAAGVFGFISFRTVAAEVKSVGVEGSKTEQELGQLEAALASTGRQAEYTADQLLKMGEGLERGLFDQGDITRATTRLLTYTNIVGEEFPDALQIAIDQAQRLGIDIEDSAEKIGAALQSPSKAMQTLARQGFVLEESQKRVLEQLEATGQTAEAQRVIMELLVESYGGSAARARIGTAAGLWKTVTENYKDFKQQISDRGVLDYFKTQLSQLLATSKRLADDGTLGRWAQQTADAIVRVANAVKGGVSFLVEYRGALLALGKAYAALKIGQAIVALNAWRIAQLAAAKAALAHAGALDATAARAARLGGVLRAIPTSIKIGVGLVGIDLAIKGARGLGEWLAKNSKEAKLAARMEEELAETYRRLSAQYGARMEQLAEHREQTIRTAEQVAQLGEEERDAYRKRLEGLDQYLSAQARYLLYQKELGVATHEQLRLLEQIPVRQAAVRAGIDAIARGTALAAEAMRRSITPAAQKILEQLGDITRDAKLAETQIGQLFEGLNYRESNTLGDVALALAEIAKEGAGADRNIRDGLLISLRRLGGEELARFQASAVAAFDEFKTPPAQIAAILDTTLLAAMQRLGVSAERIGLGFSEMGRDAVAAFGAIVENANATGVQIETAFRAALARAATPEEVQQLGALLRAAGDQGKIGFDASERSAAALSNRIREIQNAVSPLTSSFEQLGITSKAELDRARDAARVAFNDIRMAASRGEAAVEDVRAAYLRLVEAERAAVANSDAHVKRRVEGEIKVLGAVINVVSGLADMEHASESAASTIVSGAGASSRALDGVAGSAEGAASSLRRAADAASAAGDSAAAGADGPKRMSYALGQMSQEAVRALMDLNRFAAFRTTWLSLFGRAMESIGEQYRDVERQTEAIEAQAKALDPLNKQMQKLRAQYKYVDDDTLKGLAQRQQQVEEDVARRREEVRRLREEADRAAADAAKANATTDDALAKPVTDRLEIEFLAPSRQMATALRAEEQEMLDRVSSALVPRVLQMIERSRSLSNARSARRR